MIEMEAGIFNTSNSNLWTKLQRVFEAEIKAEYSKMRQAKFTEENLMKYLYGEQISQIPQHNYNLDMQNKYLNFGNQFLHACHGNGYSHMKRWVRERLFFLDTLLDYTITSADYITIRANKLGSVYLDIQTYVPMYARVKWRDEANNTGTQIKKINRGETVRFTYTMPTATDQEVIVYGGKYLKDVGDLTNLQPTTLLISKAPKLTRLVCTNNPNLINTDLSSCTLLQEIDLSGCSQLGGGIGSNPTLNVQKCTNLRRINIYDTQLTAIYTNTSGGNLQEINYPFTVQTVQIHNQPNLKSIGIPVYFINNGNENNRFANKLVSVDIANCENLTSMVKNYYEVNGQPVPVPTFLGVSSAQSFKISNSLTDLERIDLSYCANLRSLSISDFYKLTEINFDDICAWDANYSNLSEIIITNCPYVETMTFNQNTLDGPNSLGVAFAYGMTLDLSNLLNLKHIRSNVGVKGLKRIIVPPTVTSLVFDYPEDIRYSQQLSDIESIWSIDALYAHENDEYKGIDLRGMDTITDFSMGSLASIDNADNLNIKITNTFPYFNYFRNSNFFKPTGTVNISDYKGSLAYLFKGIDMDKLEIICDKQLTQTDAKYMFAYASCNNEDKIVTLFSKMQNITNLSYMFYNAFIRKAPLLPLSTTDCRYMFYNCSTMTETPANWLRSYTITPQSDYCYTGCVNINMIDGEPDTLDSIPSAWGGFGRSNVAYSGYEINATNTLEREIETATISGLSLMNIAPEYGVTPKMEDNQSSFPINNGMDQKILIKEAEYETAVLKGHSLTNLVKEKGETQEFERLTETFKMTDGLDLGVEVIDGEFIEAKLHGNTLQNIVVEDGKTSEITNVTQSFNIDNNINDGELVADGDYVSMTIKGNTLTNIVPKYSQSDPVEITGTVNVNDLVSEDVITCDGEMEKAIIKGQTKYRDIDTGDILETFEKGRNLELVSVKMLVLTTIGKNLFDKTKITTDKLIIGTGATMTLNGSAFTDYIPVEAGKTYIRNIDGATIAVYDIDKNFIERKAATTTFSATANGYIRWNFNSYASVLDTMQIEEGSTTTSYEPYKSNILTVNEDVVLRGVGEVRDTLDLMTGEVVERIGEVIFDGSVDENWELWATYPEESAIFKLSKENSLKLMKEFDKNGVFKCDKFSTVLKSSLINDGVKNPHAISFFGSDKEYIQLRVYKSLLKSIDVTGLREYLTNEPIAVQYKLATESVKTVDLTIVDQDNNNVESLHSYKDGYITTSSEQLTPTLSCVIPTSNYFSTPQMESNTQYTLYFDNEVTSVNVGGNEVTSPTSPMIVTSGSQKNMKFNGEPANVMLFKGDVREQTINYFTGTRSTSGIYINNTNNEKNNILYLPPSLALRNNGDVRDEYNPFTSQFTQRISEDDSILSSPVTTTIKSIVAYDDTVKYGYELPDKTTDLFHPEAQKYEQVIDLGTLNGTENWTKVNQYVFTVPFTNAKAGTSTDVLTQKDQVESVTIDGSTLTLTFKSDSYVGGNNIAVNALKIWLQSNNVQFKYELKDHILTDMTLEEFDFENAHFVKPQAYKGGVVTQSNKDNLIFTSMTYQTKSNNRYELPLLESNSEYTLRYEGSANQVTLGGSATSIENNCLVQSGSANKVALFNDEVSNVMLIKNDVREQTIPYFTGIKSVRMPVLKTVGKNLFDIDKAVKIDEEKFNETNYVSNNNGVLTVVADKSIEFVISKERFEVNTQYTLSFKVLGTAAFHSGWIKIYHTDGSEKTLTNSATPNVESFIKITSDANKTVDRISIFGNGLTTPEFYDIQVEKGVQSSSYEPYQSNILSCNEEVALHSIGDVCDTLDCKTGELHKYYGELTIDGSENFEWHGVQDGGTYGFNISKNEVYKKLNNYIDLHKPSICNSLEYRGNTMYGKSGEGFAISDADYAYIQLVVSLDKLLSPTIDGVRKYLSENPLHFIVPLLNKSIKTVNLSIVDQDNQPIEQMNYFTDYYGEIKSDGTLPRLTYKLQSTNTFAVPQLKPNTLYTMYSEGEATVATLGGKASILLQNPQTVTSGSVNKSLTFDSAVSRVILIESDVRNQVIPYFTGTLDVINPIIKTTSGSKTNTVNTNVRLRSVGNVRDTYDLKTGILTKRISDNYTVLDSPQTQTISVAKPISYNGAIVELSSNTTSLLPYFEYSCKSPNYYQAPIESGEIYTVKFTKTSNGTLTMGGVTANTTGNQVITTKNSDVKAILFSGDLGISDLMIMKTDVRNVPTPYFRGLKDVVNPTITVSDGNRTSNSVSITATMRSLPNGTKDELNLVTGEFVQRVGQRNYEDGDSNGPSMITDGITTLYQLPTVKRSNLSLSWSNGVLTAYDGSTIITSEAQLLKPHLYFRIPTSTLEELVSILEEKNANLASQMVDLEVENLMTMVALAEVYETIMSVPMATSSTVSNTKDILMTPMVGVYAKLVTAGVKTIDEVPEHLQINVTKLLKK